MKKFAMFVLRLLALGGQAPGQAAEMAASPGSATLPAVRHLVSFGPPPQ